jgi:hypothetical protein
MPRRTGSGGHDVRIGDVRFRFMSHGRFANAEDRLSGLRCAIRRRPLNNRVKFGRIRWTIRRRQASSEDTVEGLNHLAKMRVASRFRRPLSCVVSTRSLVAGADVGSLLQVQFTVAAHYCPQRAHDGTRLERWMRPKFQFVSEGVVHSNCVSHRGTDPALGRPRWLTRAVGVTDRRQSKTSRCVEAHAISGAAVETHTTVAAVLDHGFAGRIDRRPPFEISR